MRVVPELLVSNVEESTSFFVEILGFELKYERPEEKFVYLSLDGVDLMLEEISSTNRQWVTADLNAPFGRGVNFQWDVENIHELHTRVCKLAPGTIYLALESKEYLCGAELTLQNQFIVQTPDGYLFRFCQEDGL